MISFNIMVTVKTYISHFSFKHWKILCFDAEIIYAVLFPDLISLLYYIFYLMHTYKTVLILYDKYYHL